MKFLTLLSGSPRCGWQTFYGCSVSLESFLELHFWIWNTFLFSGLALELLLGVSGNGEFVLVLVE